MRPYRPLHSVKLPQVAKYDSIPAWRPLAWQQPSISALKLFFSSGLVVLALSPAHHLVPSEFFQASKYWAGAKPSLAGVRTRAESKSDTLPTFLQAFT